MKLIRCTQKLLKELSKFPTDIGVAERNPEGLGDWYANLLRLDRRKCLLFTNEKTLYSFLIPGVLKKDVLNIANMFFNHLAYNMQYEGFAADVIKRALEEYNEIAFAKTSSKMRIPVTVSTYPVVSFPVISPDCFHRSSATV